MLEPTTSIPVIRLSDSQQCIAFEELPIGSTGIVKFAITIYDSPDMRGFSLRPICMEIDHLADLPIARDYDLFILSPRKRKQQPPPRSLASNSSSSDSTRKTPPAKKPKSTTSASQVVSSCTNQSIAKADTVKSKHPFKNLK